MSEWVYAVDYSKGDFVDFYTTSRDNHYQLYKGDIFSIDNDEPRRIDGKIVRFQQAEVPGDLSKNFIVYKKKIRTRGMGNKFAESENLMSFKTFLDLIAKGRLIMIGNLDFREQRFRNAVAEGRDPVDDKPERDEMELPSSAFFSPPTLYPKSFFRPKVNGGEGDGDDHKAQNGGTKKKRYFRKSKKSKLTKRSRNVRRSRSRKGGMTKSGIKDEIKKLIKLDKETNQIDELAYTTNFRQIFGYWQSLQTPQRKKEFADSFVKVASYNPLVDHDTRIPIYTRIIADLKKTEEGIENGTIILQGYLRPPSVVEKEHTDITDRRLNELRGIGSNASGGKSRRRRRHNRHSSKKYKKARKSRRANRRHSRKH
jgi:hypothetical protein